MMGSQRKAVVLRQSNRSGRASLNITAARPWRFEANPESQFEKIAKTNPSAHRTHNSGSADTTGSGLLSFGETGRIRLTFDKQKTMSKKNYCNPSYGGIL
jgi:hypothetical protein